jgi:hypothetical protein
MNNTVHIVEVLALIERETQTLPEIHEWNLSMKSGLCGAKTITLKIVAR